MNTDPGHTRAAEFDRHPADQRKQFRLVAHADDGLIDLAERLVDLRQALDAVLRLGVEGVHFLAQNSSPSTRAGLRYPGTVSLFCPEVQVARRNLGFGLRPLNRLLMVRPSTTC